MSFLKRNRIFFAFFFIIALAGSVLWLDTSYTPKADAHSCEIYQAYHANLEEGIPHVFRPISNSIQFESLYKSSELLAHFVRGTGEREMVESEYFPEPYEKIIYEEFAFDSARIFEKPVFSASQRIGSCFSKIKNAPTISILPANVIEFLRFGLQPSKTEDGLMPAFNANFLTVHEISSPLFTADKRYGLIYAGSYCGGLCGHGGYFIFENLNGGWQQIGFHTLWVS